MIPNVQSMGKNDKLGFIKIINLYYMKGAIKRVKKEAWKKISANHILTKDLYTKYIKYSQNSAIRKQTLNFFK